MLSAEVDSQYCSDQLIIVCRTSYCGRVCVMLSAEVDSQYCSSRKLQVAGQEPAVASLGHAPLTFVISDTNWFCK